MARSNWKNIALVAAILGGGYLLLRGGSSLLDSISGFFGGGGGGGIGGGGPSSGPPSISIFNPPGDTNPISNVFGASALGLTELGVGYGIGRYVAPAGARYLASRIPAAAKIGVPTPAGAPGGIVEGILVVPAFLFSQAGALFRGLNPFSQGSNQPGGGVSLAPIGPRSTSGVISSNVGSQRHAALPPVHHWEPRIAAERRLGRG